MIGQRYHPPRQTGPAQPQQNGPPVARSSDPRGPSHRFIRANDGREVFFHRSDTTFGTFNSLTVSTRSLRSNEDRVSGPRATAMRLPKNARA